MLRLYNIIMFDGKQGDDLNQDAMTRLVAEKVEAKIAEVKRYMVPVGVSNRHVHVTKEAFAILFGEDAVMTKKADVKQPGQFAANECVTIVGPKGEFSKVRILGPERKYNQVEISKTDCFKLGVKPSIKMSGNHVGTPGLTLVGPKGQVQIDQGCIVALRHIHMVPEQAKELDLHDGEVVDVEVFGERKGIFGNVIMRVTDASALEMHIDTDEANAMGLKNNDMILIRKKK